MSELGSVPARVLVFRLGSLGDALVGLPALRVVARAFPESERWLLTNCTHSPIGADMEAVLTGTGLVHGYIRYALGLRGVRSLAALRQEIRAFGPDVLVYLAAARGRVGTLRDAAFFRLCGVRRIVGIPYRRSQREPRYLGDGLYEAEGARLVRCVKELGGIEAGDWELRPTRAERRDAERRLKELSNLGRIVAVSIGGKVNVKDWGAENWRAALGEVSARLRGWSLVMIGAAAERERSEEIASAWAGQHRNFAGELTVRESGAVLATAKVFIGHDNGPMHLAAAVGTPCVAVFSSRNLPGEWFPHGHQHRVLYQSIACQGCRLDECVDLKKACIASIGVRDVVSEVLAVLSSQPM